MARNYGRGSWASSLRYHNGTFYVSTFSNSSGMNYIFQPKIRIKPLGDEVFQTHGARSFIVFDDDGKVYMFSCGGKIGIRELKSDLSGIKEGTERILVENADAITGKERVTGRRSTGL